MAPTWRISRAVNRAMAWVQAGSLLARKVRMSALRPDRPSNLLCSYSRCCSSCAVWPWLSKCSNTPGSSVPQRVPMMSPSSAVVPMVVASERPRRAAHRLAPLPRWAMSTRHGFSESGRSQYVGDVLEYDAARGLAKVNVRNKFAVGDWLEILHPSGNFDVQLTRMENADAAEVQVAPGSGHTMWIPLPETAVGAFVARYLTAREQAALPA